MNPAQIAADRLADARGLAASLQQASGGVNPSVLVILGSGLEGVIGEIDVVSRIAFAQVPGFPPPTVEGHAGQFVFGRIGDTSVVVMQGRIHLYEGHPVEMLALYVRAAKLMGVETLVVTNAAGGVNPDLAPGDIVLIEDHMNLMFTNPLLGPNVEEFGPRFPGMVGIYTPGLLILAREVAGELGIPICGGIYAGLTGPTFETPAEVRMLRALGADVVGMSTVPEVIAAAHAGMRVLGFSLVTNVAGSDGHGHEEVLATSAESAPTLARLVAGILTRL